MYTLFFKESPLIAIILIILSIISLLINMPIIAGIIISSILACIYFYRYDNKTYKFPDNYIVSANEGKITNISTKNGKIYISTYMNIFNRHTQIYPITGIVTKRYYDKNGTFENTIKLDKSRFNEKKIHTIQTKYGDVIITQIAGLLVRCITSSDKVPEKVNAGDYMGMIKFGSRVDIEFTGDIDKVKVNVGDNVKIGDVIYIY